MRGGLPPRGAAPLGRALVLAVGLALLLAACAREFATQPAVAPRLDRGAGWRDTLSVTDTAVLEFQLTAGNSDTLAPARATWASSDDRVLRVEPLAATSGDAARDTLAARRTRVRVIAGGPGAVTLTVRTEPAAGLAAAERAFPVVVRPLRYVPVRWRAALSAGESDTLQVEVRDVVRGRVLADRPLRWQSSDETRLRIVPIPAAGAAADPAAERRLRVRAVALADGQVSVTVGLDPSVAAAGSDTTLAVDVAPLTIARSAGQDTLAVADTATFQVRLGTRFTDSLPGRFTWESSNDAVLRLTTPAPTNVAAADTLAARGARRVVTALAPGTATVTATSIPTGGEAAVQRSWAIGCCRSRSRWSPGPTRSRWTTRRSTRCASSTRCAAGQPPTRRSPGGRVPTRCSPSRRLPGRRACGPRPPTRASTATPCSRPSPSAPRAPRPVPSPGGCA
jgi:hypothetical protein